MITCNYMGKIIWFKRKTYGWGWTPISWQGWAVSVLFVGLVLVPARALPDYFDPKGLLYWVYVLLLTSILLFICLKKGEAPRWQWGRQSNKSNKH